MTDVNVWWMYLAPSLVQMYWHLILKGGSWCGCKSLWCVQPTNSRQRLERRPKTLHSFFPFSFGNAIPPHSLINVKKFTVEWNGNKNYIGRVEKGVREPDMSLTFHYHDVAWKLPLKMRNLKPLSLSVFFFALACERTFVTPHSIERR